MKKCIICKVVVVLAAIGALNWGLVALFGLDLVASALGAGTGGAKAVYALIGLSGLLALAGLLNLCPCSKAGCAAK